MSLIQKTLLVTVLASFLSAARQDPTGAPLLESSGRNSCLSCIPLRSFFRALGSNVQGGVTDSSQRQRDAQNQQRLVPDPVEIATIRRMRCYGQFLDSFRAELPEGITPKDREDIRIVLAMYFAEMYQELRNLLDQGKVVVVNLHNVVATYAITGQHFVGGRDEFMFQKRVIPYEILIAHIIQGPYPPYIICPQIILPDGTILKAYVYNDCAPNDLNAELPEGFLRLPERKLWYPSMLPGMRGYEKNIICSRILNSMLNSPTFQTFVRTHSEDYFYMNPRRLVRRYRDKHRCLEVVGGIDPRAQIARIVLLGRHPESPLGHPLYSGDHNDKRGGRRLEIPCGIEYYTVGGEPLCLVAIGQDTINAWLDRKEMELGYRIIPLTVPDDILNRIEVPDQPVHL